MISEVDTARNVTKFLQPLDSSGLAFISNTFADDRDWKVTWTRDFSIFSRFCAVRQQYQLADSFQSEFGLRKSLQKATGEIWLELKGLHQTTLYACKAENGKVLSVAFAKSNYFSEPILAQEVPAGTELSEDGAKFFTFWKGSAIVRSDGTLFYLKG